VSDLTTDIKTIINKKASNNKIVVAKLRKEYSDSP
jgi:hypothetical protein